MTTWPQRKWDVRSTGRRAVLVTRFVHADHDTPWTDVATFEDQDLVVTVLDALRSAAGDAPASADSIAEDGREAEARLP